MKDNIYTIIITLVIFLIGLCTGIWTQTIRPLPPPNAPFMGEFGSHDFMGIHHEKMDEMHKAMAEAAPEIQAFENKINDIVNEYREKIKAVLTKDQLPLLDQFLPESSDIVTSTEHGQMSGSTTARVSRDGSITLTTTSTEPNTMTGSTGMPPQITVLARGGAFSPPPPFIAGPIRFVGMIIYKPTLEAMTTVLKLDEKQKAKIETLLRERREKIINLVDTTPPPSLGVENNILCPNQPQATGQREVKK